MSTETTAPETGSDGLIAPQAALAAVLEAYREMGISVTRYVLLVLAPATLVALGLVAAALVLSLPPTLAAPVVAVGGFVLLVALVFPKLQQDRRRRQVRARFHLFLTHITVLSMTNIDRVDIFRTLANEESYGALADELNRIVALVDTWNQSLEDACRMRAQQVSSPLLSDFLERLAYTIGAGQELNEFLVEEQDSIIEEFVIRYRNDLNRLDVFKELYLSMLMSVTFVVVFALLVPFLLGVPATLAVASVIGLFVLVQVGFLVAVNSVAPSDPVWYVADGGTHSPTGRVSQLLVVATLLTVLLAAVEVLFLDGLVGEVPLVVLVAGPLTPLVVPGLYMRRREAEVKQRDEEFPNFIRALGSVESVKQSSTANVLATLRRKNFGPLTATIDSLYKRLRMRIDSRRAWRLFAVESGSNLIQKFGDMYVVGRRMGGEPSELGGLISDNMNQVLKVREQRSQTTRTLIGVIYGITFASVFSFYVGVEIVELLVEIVSEMDLEGSPISFILNAAVYDLPTLRVLVGELVVVNALLSAVLIRLADRGHFVTSLLHLVLLVWMSGITAYVTQVLVGSLISV